MNKALNIEKKKGDPLRLDGNVIVYAKIDIDPEDYLTMKHPVASMIHGGMLAVQGNYKEQNSLREFLLNEMGISLDSEGIDDELTEMIEGLDGLESALDPAKLRKKLDNISEIEDFIPTPAKMVAFHSEQELLAQPGDIYCTGSYKGIGNAVLSINAVPIIYQALFKEQQAQSLHSEIESLISQIECGEQPGYTVTSPEVDPEATLLKEYIPLMLYQRTDPAAFSAAQKQFRAFMRGYRFNDDVEAIISLISDSREAGVEIYRLLELYAKKIAFVLSEDFARVETVRREIESISLLGK